MPIQVLTSIPKRICHADFNSMIVHIQMHSEAFMVSISTTEFHPFPFDLFVPFSMPKIFSKFIHNLTYTIGLSREALAAESPVSRNICPAFLTALTMAVHCRPE
jgi:hypothetical protein